MDLFSPEQSRLIRMAGPEELEECGNEAYMEARGTIELLKDELASYKIKVATLTDVLERTIILKAADARTTQDQDNGENKRSGLPPLCDYPPATTRAQYPAVRYWTRCEYNRARRKDKGNTNALATGRPKRGRPRREFDSDAEDDASAWDSQADPNKTPKHPYLETVDGTPADHETLFAIGLKARRIWQTLAKEGIAPMTWGAITDSAYEYFTREMLNAFIEFRLCDNNWKLHYWVTRNYPSWHQNHLKEKASVCNNATASASGSGTMASSASGSELGATNFGMSSVSGLAAPTNPGVSNTSGSGATNPAASTSGLGATNPGASTPGSGARHSGTTGRTLHNPSNEDEFPEQERDTEENCGGDEVSHNGEGGGEGTNNEVSHNGEDGGEGMNSEVSRNSEGNGEGTNNPGEVPGNDQGTSDGNHQGTEQETIKRTAQSDASDVGNRPSKRPKNSPALAVPGPFTTERCFAMRAWVINNPGGLRRDFDAWFKALSAQEREPFSEAAKAVSLLLICLATSALFPLTEQESKDKELVAADAVYKHIKSTIAEGNRKQIVANRNKAQEIEVNRTTSHEIEQNCRK